MDTKRILNNSLNSFEGSLARVLTDYRRSVQSLMLSNLTKQGKIITLSDPNINFVAQSYASLGSLLYESGYGDLVQRFLADESGLLDKYIAIRPQGAVPIEFTQRFTEQLTVLRRAELFEFEAIGRDAVSALQREVMRGVLTGVSTDVLAENITGSMNTHLQQYSWTYANTARANFIQTVEDVNAERSVGGGQYWEYVGPEDDKNREACIVGLDQRYFTDSERAEFESAWADDRAWNCRHTFMEITKEYYEQNTR